MEFFFGRKINELIVVLEEMYVCVLYTSDEIGRKMLVYVRSNQTQSSLILLQITT